MNATLRKAAILISALDRASADRLLEQMGDEQSQRVRQVMVDLEEISDAEQEAVLAEFLGKQNAAPATQPDDDNIEYSVSPEAATASLALEQANQPAPNFDFLQQIPTEELAAALRKEHPQVLAVVIAYLPPAQGAAVLRHCPALLREEVLERLSQGEDIAPAVQEELVTYLRQRFIHVLSKSQPTAQRLQHVASILEHLQPAPPLRVITPEANEQWEDDSAIDALVNSDPTPDLTAVHELDAPVFEFAELMALPAADFFAVFDEADPRYTLLALAGAPRRLFERYLAQFSPEHAAECERHIEQLRPLQLRDVDFAQHELAKIASRRMQLANHAAENSPRFTGTVQ